MWLAGNGFPALRVLLLKRGGTRAYTPLSFTFGEIYLLCFLVGGLLILLSDNAHIFSSLDYLPHHIHSYCSQQVAHVAVGCTFDLGKKGNRAYSGGVFCDSSAAKMKTPECARFSILLGPLACRTARLRLLNRLVPTECSVRSFIAIALAVAAQGGIVG